MTRAQVESLLLFGTAFALRAVLPDACIFTQDQYGTLLNGHAVLAGDWFAPGPGIGWSAFLLGPLYNQVAAIVFLVRDEFADVVVLAAALHGVSVLGVRTIVARLADARVARLAAWTLALNIASISTGSTPISSSLVLPTTTLFVGGIVWWIQSQEPRGFALACIGAALMVQAHVMPALLLPCFLLGWYARAPIGRVGLAGLLAAAAIAAPMLAHNLRLVEQASGYRHAGTEGASFLVALTRAITLEARTITILPELDRLADLGLAFEYVFAGIMVLGVLVTFRSPRSRGVLGFTLLLPTLLVAALPRGAFLYHLDSTVAYRAWAFAAGAVTIGSWLKDRPPMRAMAIALMILGLAIPAMLSVRARVETAARGYNPVMMARLDLREPPGSREVAIGVPTLGTQRALAAAFDRLGARPDTFAKQLHGPWRWMIAPSTVAWMPRESQHPASPRSLLLLHESERQPVPGGAPVVAGRFHIHVFDDRFVAGPSAPGSGTVGGDGPVFVQAVVQPGEVARLRGDDGSPQTTLSPAGFVVASTRLGGGGAITFDVVADSAGSPLVRSAPDVYAFSADR